MIAAGKLVAFPADHPGLGEDELVVEIYKAMERARLRETPPKPPA